LDKEAYWGQIRGGGGGQEGDGDGDGRFKTEVLTVPRGLIKNASIYTMAQSEIGCPRLKRVATMSQAIHFFRDIQLHYCHH